MKTFLQYLATFLVFGVVVVALSTWDLGKWYKANHPHGKFEDVQGFVDYASWRVFVRKTVKDGDTFFIAYNPPKKMNEMGHAVPSGPPAYVFDSKGQLVDWSLDTGEDPEFFRKWSKGWSESSLEELKGLVPQESTL